MYVDIVSSLSLTITNNSGAGGFDVMTVGSSRIGAVNLGSTLYVTATSTFTGSAVTWTTGTTSVLRITLGTLAAGLAHELNNPASAATRAADALAGASRGVMDALARLSRHDITAAQFGDQHAARDAVGAQAVQDRLREAREVLREPRIAVQRVAVTREPVDQRLVLGGGQRHLGVGLAVGLAGGRQPGEHRHGSVLLAAGAQL